MKSEKKYTFSVSDDNNGENFSKSKCKCNECIMMHISQKEWKKFKPKNNLQRRMLNIVKKIEKNS
jgi:hypothetical protein|tara:strand:- start:4082 stop:4276 length:195 start_codon:yes stop_codon:yes gene_type:complete